MESLSRAMPYSICGFEKSFWQLCAGWKGSKERHLRLKAEKSMWRLLHGPGENRQKPEPGQWQYRWRKREELEKIGSPKLLVIAWILVGWGIGWRGAVAG